jgi:hypothetical protein
LDLELLGCFFSYIYCFVHMTLFSLCVCKVAVMDREEWMCKLPRVSNDMSFLVHVKKFVAAMKKHRLRLGRDRTICPCNSYKNKLL